MVIKEILILIIFIACLHFQTKAKVVRDFFHEGIIIKQDSLTTYTNLCNHWMLTKRKSSNNKDYYKSSGGAYRELVLFPNGRYEQKSESYNTAGNWKLKINTIGFYMTEENGNPWGKSIDYNYSWEIVEVDSTKLILRILGRHGFEYYYYEPKKTL